MNHLPTPLLRFVAITAIGLIGLACAMVLAQNHPWLGVSFAATDTDAVVVSQPGIGPAAGLPANVRVTGIASPSEVQSGGPVFAITPRTVMEEPDGLRDHADMQAFRTEQQAIATLLRKGEVWLIGEDTTGAPLTHTITPAPSRPISDLPSVFWVQAMTGLLGTILGAWVWAFRPNDRAPQLVLATGMALQLSATAAALYGTRELAQPALFLRLANAANFIGSIGFATGMVLLFFSYPRQLLKPARLAQLTAFFALWSVLSLIGVMPSNAVAYQLPLLVALLMIVFGIWRQHRKTAGDPVARASLSLFGLCVVVGVGTFAFLRLVPVALGLPVAVSQGYAFALFLFVYIGLALSVLRYRLFDLGRWSFNLLFYFVGALALLLVDAALIYGLALERAPALGMALLVIALLYLPTRDWAARQLGRRRDHRRTGLSLVRAADAVLRAEHGREREQSYQDTLRRLFAPLEIVPQSDAPAQTRVDISQNGEYLRLPNVPGILPAMSLRWAHGGRRLFTRENAADAQEFLAILHELAEGRRAYDKGVSSERARIARDIHDNVGFSLMGALHSGEAGRKDELIRETLTDLRDIIAQANRTEADLAQILADLRLTTLERMEQQNITLDWPVTAIADVALPAETAHALRSVLREALNNAERHAEADWVGVIIDVKESEVHVRVRDNGVGLPAIRKIPSPDGGNGLVNIEKRVTELGGTFTLNPAPEGGVELSVTLPLRTSDAMPLQPRRSAT